MTSENTFLFGLWYLDSRCEFSSFVIKLNMFSDHASYNFVYPITYSFIVTPTVLILSLGNNSRKHSLLEIVLAIVGIALLIFFPAFYDGIDTPIFSTKDQKIVERDNFTSQILDTINIFVGIALLFFQCCNLVRWAVPDDKLTSSKFLGVIIRGSGVKAEFALKHAAIRKVHIMMENALDLHFENDDDLPSNDGHRVNKQMVILNYLKVSGK